MVPAAKGGVMAFGSDFDRDELFSAMKKRGIIRVLVEFSGGDDEGGVDRIEVEYEDGRKAPLDCEYYESVRYNADRTIDTIYYGRGGGPVEADALTPEQVDQARFYKNVCNTVYSQYGSFAGDFYVNGLVYIEANESGGTITSNNDERVERYETTVVNL